MLWVSVRGISLRMDDGFYKVCVLMCVCVERDEKRWKTEVGGVNDYLAGDGLISLPFFSF